MAVPGPHEYMDTKTRQVPKGPRTQIIGLEGPKTLLFGSLDP